MILVADSGSTSTRWTAAYDSGKLIHIDTEGLNPLTTPKATFTAICREVRSQLPQSDRHSKLYFYSAGCGTAATQQQASQMLSLCFTDYTVEVAGDLLGACRALCGDRAGMVGILGTGSNVCYYDGNNIADQITSLGYLLGDEGSANHIGKKLLKSFFNHTMPETLALAFKQQYDIDVPTVIDHLYHHPCPNRYLGTFALFASAHRSDPFIQNALKQSFMEFWNNQVKAISQRSHCTQLHLVGSVADAFKAEIAATLGTQGCTLGTIVKAPGSKLIEYHLLKQ